MADEDLGQNELISQFVSLTGTDPETTKIYLEARNWDLESALGDFFDEVPPEQMDDESDVTYIPPQTSDSPTVKTRSSSGVSNKKNQRFATIDSFNTQEAVEDSDDEEGQAFYAGGSETSGQQIVGPPRKKKEKPSEMTQSIFDAAKRHGAEVVDRVKEESDKKKKSSAFRGSGFRLGDTEGVSSVVQDPTASNLASEEPADVDLNFWSNGFSVDDGPLRAMDDPASSEFLQSIRRGEIPQELLRLHRGRKVNFNMIDKRNEDYVKPKETVKAFAGEGRKLGSPAPKVVTSRTPSSATSASSSGEVPKVDDSQPVTNLQLRLADGTRLVAKFNHSSTIRDVRRFVNASRPQMAGREYILMTTFPRKELTDENLTLADASLLNAVVVQQFR